jgi:hypothetical protein
MSRSTCCNALLLKDETGDRVCTVCGLIEDNYPEDGGNEE